MSVALLLGHRSGLSLILVIIAGPDLPTALDGHSMVSLGLGQAILGGIDDNAVFQNRIYHITCSQQICMVSNMNLELSILRAFFVAIPIPDSMSGCISQSKFGFIRDFHRVNSKSN